MSKHYADAWYYLGRAVYHTKAGVSEDVGPVVERVRELAGAEPAPAPSRLDRLEAELKDLSSRAEGDAKQAVQVARDRLRLYRRRPGAE